MMLKTYRLLLSLLLACCLIGLVASFPLEPRGPAAVLRPLAVADEGDPPARSVVVRLYVRDRDHLNAVAGQLDIWEAHPDARYVVARVSPLQDRWLQSLGYHLEIDAEKTALLYTNAPLDSRFHYFDSYYPNSSGRYIVQFLQNINTAFPSLTELMDIGDAWMAGWPGEHPRDIWVLRITNEDPAYGPIVNKPAFFLFANIHAREVATPELAIRYIRYLTEGYNGMGGYGIDPDVTWLVDHHVAYVLVMQNPDGHWKNEQDTSNYRRKNMDWDDGCADPGSWGVDLNRNHSFKWGCCGGSSPSPCDETYRGLGRASEPETQAFETFFASVMKDQNGPNGDDQVPPAAPITTTGIFISLHSYSDLVLWPWGWTSDPTPNGSQLQAIGRKFAFYNGYDPSGMIWYTVDGATDDWTYGKFGIASFTFEVGPNSGPCGGFFPAYGCIDGIDGMPRNFWAENRPAFLYAHKIARTPYKTVYGPDTEPPAIFPDAVPAGTPVQVQATIADHRYSGDPLRPIAGAEYFIDAPGTDGTGVPMMPLDGAWGGLSEVVTATINTSSLSPGRHYILVHGKNNQGDWGPLTASFLTVTVPLSPSLSITTMASSDVLAVGLPLVYTVTVTNDGGPASGVRVTDTLPANTLFAWADQGGTFDGSDVLWSDLTVPAHGTLAVSYGVTVTCVPSGTPIVNDGYVVTATEWPTPTTGLPVTVTAVSEGVTADFSFGPLPVLVGRGVNFSNLSRNATAYEWDFGDGATSTLEDPAHVYGAVGTYTAVLTASNICALDVARQVISVGDYAVVLEPGMSIQSGDPGEAVVHTLWVTNTGTLADVYQITRSGSSWATTLSTTTLALGAGERQPVTVTVVVPANVAGGAWDRTTVTVRSQSDPRTPAASAAAVLTTTARSVYGIALGGAVLEQEGRAGEVVTYTLRVTNTGNVADTIVLTRTTPGWPTVFSWGSQAIAAGGWREVKVAIEVAGDALAGAEDRATIRASGSGGSAEVTLVTRMPVFRVYLPLVLIAVSR